jgi:two-component system, sensor histidine kinase
MTHHRNISSQHFQLLFENAPGSFLILLPDADFTIVGVTNEYLQETLTTRENLLGKPVFDMFPDNPDTPEANSKRNLNVSLQRVVATRAPDTMTVQRYDVRGRDGAGFEVRYWSPVNTPVLSAEGELLYIIHRVQNVTEYIRLTQDNETRQRKSQELSEQNRRMEAEILQRSLELAAKNKALQHANQELTRYANQARAEAQNKDEFLAMLAHELRNPLAGISSALELLEVIGHDADKSAQLHQVCHRQLGNLTRLVDDLLDVSRVSRGEMHLRKEPLDVQDIVESALHALRGLLDGRDLAIHTSIASGMYSMLGDATRLEQVLTNLLANAAKYTSDGGRIDIALAKEAKGDAQWAVLQVKDTGRGIPPDKLSAIFGMFVQVDASVDRTHGGLGIGLTLVQKLVELHGGTVEAESQGLGFGSTFTVRLPLDASVSVPASHARRGIVPGAESPGTRVLIIEDNDDAREMLKSLLEAYGYAVEAAATGDEGLKLLLARCPDVAIVDIGLPGLDGFELARRARAAPEGKAVKLVALSGYSGPDTEHKAAAAGFNLHLVKPVSAADLPRIVRTGPHR